MSTKRIDVKSGRLFPWQYHVLAAMLLIVAIAFLQSYFIISLVLLLVSLFIFTGYSGMEIDYEGKKYRPYYAFFFFKSGKVRSYDEVEKIYINSANVSQRIYTAHTNSSIVAKNHIFDAYIKFGNGDKEYLLSKKNKDLLFARLKELSYALKVKVVDNTV